MKDKLRVGVVGVGHFGRHHARVYSELEDVELVGVADVDAERATGVAAAHDTRAFSDPHELLGLVDAVSVVVPTHSHRSVSCDFLERGVSVLVEKPMAPTLEDARAIQAAAGKTGARLQVGHIMRFSPIVMAMRELNIQPKFLEVHRLRPFSFRSIDVGVVLDMMIHDIDLVLQLVSGKLEKVNAVAFALVGKTEDICNARLAFDDGCVANITASRVALKSLRKVRIFSPTSYISLDFDRNSGLIISGTPGRKLREADFEKMKTLSLDELKDVMLDFFTLKEMKLDEHEPLRAELCSFVDCVKNGSTPLVSGEDGIRSLQTAERVLEAVRAHDWYR